jgi:hypothetical protein
VVKKVEVLYGYGKPNETHCAPRSGLSVGFALTIEQSTRSNTQFSIKSLKAAGEKLLKDVDAMSLYSNGPYAAQPNAEGAAL